MLLRLSKAIGQNIPTMLWIKSFFKCGNDFACLLYTYCNLHQNCKTADIFLFSRSSCMSYEHAVAENRTCYPSLQFFCLIIVNSICTVSCYCISITALLHLVRVIYIYIYIYILCTSVSQLIKVHIIHFCRLSCATLAFQN